MDDYDREISEQELLILLATDLRSNFWLLVQAYQTMLYRFALRGTRNPQDAEDVFQNVMVNVFRALEEYPTERILTLKLQAWLYKITSREIYKVLKGLPLSISIDPSDNNPFSHLEADLRDQPEVAFEVSEAFEELVEQINRLPESCSQIFFLYYFENLSYQEIVEHLNIPLGTVKSYIHRCKKLLQQKVLATKKDEVSQSHDITR